MPSKLARDLMTLPDLVGNFGVSIANAQKLMNDSYLETVAAYMTIFGAALRPESKELWGDAAVGGGEPPKSLDAVKSLLEQIAPSRYQFTETRIDFRAELFEARDLLVRGGFGGGFGGAMITVSGAYGSRSEYRAAARVTSTIHAIPSSEKTMAALLARVKEIGDIEVPTSSPERGRISDLDGLDKTMLEKITEIRARLGDDVGKQREKLEGAAPRSGPPLATIGAAKAPKRKAPKRKAPKRKAPKR